MDMKNTFLNIKRFTLISILLLGLYSCEKKWDAPDKVEPVKMTPNTTISELKAMYNGAATEIGDDVIIAGKVVSSDKDGNIYKSLYIMDNTAGIEIKIGKTGLYNDYKEGQTLHVKAKHLWLGAYGGVVQLGAKSTDPKYESSYLDAQMLIDMTIFKGEQGTKVEPKLVSSKSELNDNMLGTLVTLKSITYNGSDKVGGKEIFTWAIKENFKEGQEATSVNQNFYWGNSKIVVRSSGYAKFANEPCPLQNSTPADAKGTVVNITGVLTKFYNTYQIILNSSSGVVKSSN